MRHPVVVATLCLALAACAATPKPPAVVKVPILTKCTPTFPERPVFAADAVGLDSDIFQLVQALLIDRLQRQRVMAEERAALEACAG